MNRFLFSLFSLMMLFFGFAAPLYAQTTKGNINVEESIPLPDELKEAETINENRFASEFFHMVLVLGLIIALLYFGAWMFRRMLSQRVQQMNITSNIKVIEQRVLSPKSALYIIEAFGKTILISESHNGVKFLSELPEDSNASE